MALTLQSNLNIRNVAGGISSNRGSMREYAQYGATSRLFMRANRYGGTPVTSARNMAIRANRDMHAYRSGYVAGGNSVSASRTVNVSTPASYSAGLSIGTGINAAMQAIGMLNQMGIFSKGDTPTNISAGNTLTDRMQSAFGNYTPVNPSDLSSIGLPKADSYGANFDATYSSVEAYMRSETMDPGALRTSAQNLVSTAYNDVNQAEATFNILKGRQADAMTNQKTLLANRDNADTDMKNAKAELGTRQGTLQSAKLNRTQKDEVLSAQDETYKNACTNLTAKEGIKDKKQAEVSTCQQGVATAKSALTQATANKNAAQKAYDAIPNDAEHSAQKAAAKSALEQAIAAETKAQESLREAEEKLTNAQEELTQAEAAVTAAREAKENALKALEKNHNDLQDAIAQCRKAEKDVQNAQNGFDDAQKTFDMTNSNLTQAQAALDDAQGVIAHCEEFNTKMQTLKDNLSKATKLQEKADKAADKYEKKHPGSTS